MKEECDHAIGTYCEWDSYFLVHVSTEGYYKNNLDEKFNFCPTCGERITPLYITQTLNILEEKK